MPPNPPQHDAGKGDQSTVVTSSTVPAQIAQFRVERELGRGGMGVVYLARDPRLDRPVAIKVLPAERTSQDMRRRFEREARTAAQLSHPNIATIYELGESEQTYFIAMEYIEGRTLRDVLLRPQRMPFPEALDLAGQVAEGLAAAHGRKIVHRDLKPQNIMLTPEGRVKILDFGLAKIFESVTQLGHATVESTTELTTEQRVLGTTGYMSPEQARGQGVDARSDLFTFGILLYEMVTGEMPFQGESGADILSAILRDTPPPAHEYNADVPPELDQIIGRCLEKEREARYQSTQELLGDLRRVSQSVKRGQPQPTPSIAVLAFANLSADPENEYFTDGMAEEIINALSKIKALRVASRTSAFAFKGRSEDIRKIGQQLNVRSVLEGSVRKAGNRLRITAQLVNVADGYHLWSERYDRDLEDVFAVQDEIAQSITRALRVVLTEKEKRAIEKVPTADVQAYDYYLRGRQFFHQLRRKGCEFAESMFKRAIEIDPGYALAQAGVADCSSLLYLDYGASEAHLHEADKASRKALELDPELAEAHVARGLAISLKGKLDEARLEFETAIQLAPQLFDAYFFYARACFGQGMLHEAARLFEQAWRVRPDDYQAPTLLAMVYVGLGRQTESHAMHRRAREVIQRHLELNPDDARATYLGACVWARLGERALALEWAKRALAMDPEEPRALYGVACVYAVLGEAEEAIECLEQSIALGERYRGWLENDPDLDSLRDDPRFKALLEKM